MGYTKTMIIYSTVGSISPVFWILGIAALYALFVGVIVLVTFKYRDSGDDDKQDEYEGLSLVIPEPATYSDILKGNDTTQESVDSNASMSEDASGNAQDVVVDISCSEKTIRVGLIALGLAAAGVVFVAVRRLRKP